MKNRLRYLWSSPAPIVNAMEMKKINSGKLRAIGFDARARQQ
jgi:hypothetical protein